MNHTNNLSNNESKNEPIKVKIDNDDNTTLVNHEPKTISSKKIIPDINVDEPFITKKSKIIAYFLAVTFGYVGGHQVYLTQISKKPYKQDNFHALRSSPFLIGWIALIVGGKISLDEENGFIDWLDLITTGESANFFTYCKDFGGFSLIFLGLASILVFLIFDLLTLGKQVDRWNSKHASNI